METLIVIFWFLAIGQVVLLFANIHLANQKRKKWKEKEDSSEKEYEKEEEDIERLLRILGDKNKVNSYEERKDAWIEAEKGINKEIDDYERSRKAKLAKIKSEYDRMERAAEQDYLAYIERLNKIRENENKDN